MARLRPDEEFKESWEALRSADFYSHSPGEF